MGNSNNPVPCAGKCLGREGPDFYVPFDSVPSFKFDHFFNKEFPVVDANAKGARLVPVNSKKGMSIPCYEATYPLYRTKSPQKSKVLAAGRVLLDINLKDVPMFDDFLRQGIYFVFLPKCTMFLIDDSKQYLQV